MNIPRFWASASGSTLSSAGKSVPVKTFGWSESNVDEARTRARESLVRLLDRIARGMPFPDRYTYAERPIREEILSVVRGEAGEMSGLVTRNGYGAEVLNTANVMFVDIDDPPPPIRSITEVIRGWFGSRPPTPVAEPELPPVVATFAAAHPAWSLRCYRTRAGWRLLITHDVFPPADDRTREILLELESDPKYLELTRIQECFRARLSPKPWRCGVARARRDFPRESAAEEQAHSAWLTRYKAASTPFATCRFVKSLGPVSVCAAARPIVALHDRETRAETGLPLA